MSPIMDGSPGPSYPRSRREQLRGLGKPKSVSAKTLPWRVSPDPTTLEYALRTDLWRAVPASLLPKTDPETAMVDAQFPVFTSPAERKPCTQFLTGQSASRSRGAG